MAAIFLSAKLLYRRMDIVNVAALAALTILAARPSEIAYPSFILSFCAVATIGAIGASVDQAIERTLSTCAQSSSDVTRDVSHPPHAIQFRIEMRAAYRMACPIRLPRSVAPIRETEPVGPPISRSRCFSGKLL